MEAHVCVWQTVRDLLPSHNVHVLADALASRSDDNYRLGLGLCEQAGAVITSTEAVLFDMLQQAGGDTFKAVSKIVR
jgi:isochorismate hydrolase